MDTMSGQQLDGLAANTASGTGHQCYLAVKTECQVKVQRMYLKEVVQTAKSVLRLTLSQALKLLVSWARCSRR